jgi:membrane-associated phospholipid phosphatase
LRFNDLTTRFHLITTDLLQGFSFSGSGQTAALNMPGGATLTLMQPPPPTLQAQLNLVLARRDERTDRTAEILTQVTPQYAFWSAICGLHPARHAHTIELSLIALQVSMLITQRLKHELAVPRPVELSPHVQPIIQTPAYFAWPSGHATEAFVFARLMDALRVAAAVSGYAQERAVLFNLAERIADNRVVAGLHYPMDGAAGYVLADAFVSTFVARATGGHGAFNWECDGEKLQDAHASAAPVLDETLYAHTSGAFKKTPRGQGAQAIVKSDLVGWLWDKAVEELKY